MKFIKLKLFLLASVFSLGLSLEAQLAPALNDAVDNGDGSFSTWFGNITPAEGVLTNSGWYQHEEHGRLYIIASNDYIWFYDENIANLGDPLTGFTFTASAYFPQMYVHGAGWYFYVPGVEAPGASPRIFINREGNSLTLPRVAPDTIVDVASSIDDFSSLVSAVAAAGLVETLSSDGPLTVFAPTNAAFAEIDSDMLNDLLTNPASQDALINILGYHVIPGRITSDMLGLDVINLLKGATASGFAEMFNGSDLRIDVTPFGVMLNNTAMVINPDIEVGNGVIHVIDEVLMPPADIVDTAINAGLFNTLYAAIDAAGLEDTLRNGDDLTVFAPTDDAFAALPDGTLDALLADPATLANILAYHVVAAEVYSADVALGPVQMFNGDSATVSVSDSGDLMIDGATITVTDIVASNGVIHVIDAVILPPAPAE